MQISFDSLLQLDLNLIRLALFNFIMVLVKVKPLVFFFAQIHLFNSIFLQKTNSRNKIQLSTKLIIQHYSKTNYKMHELTQNKYDNAF